MLLYNDIWVFFVIDCWFYSLILDGNVLFLIEKFYLTLIHALSSIDKRLKLFFIWSPWFAGSCFSYFRKNYAQKINIFQKSSYSPSSKKKIWKYFQNLLLIFFRNLHVLQKLYHSLVIFFKNLQIFSNTLQNFNSLIIWSLYSSNSLQNLKKKNYLKNYLIGMCTFF
jgi:hypothetical protein